MFDIGWSELMLIGIVALIVIGPKELPTVLRTVGRTVTKLRRMAGEFQGQFQEALREADLADMRKEISDVTETARSTLATSEMFDPLRSIREEIRSTVEKASPAAALSALNTPSTADAPASLGVPAPEEAAPLPPPELDPLQAVRDEIRRSVAKAAPAGAPSPAAAPAGETGPETKSVP